MGEGVGEGVGVAAAMVPVMAVAVGMLRSLLLVALVARWSRCGLRAAAGGSAKPFP